MGVATPLASNPSQNVLAEVDFCIVSACIADSSDYGHSDFVMFGTLRNRDLITELLGQHESRKWSMILSSSRFVPGRRLRLEDFLYRSHELFEPVVLARRNGCGERIAHRARGTPLGVCRKELSASDFPRCPLSGTEWRID
jgi:hypothetical protein